MSGAYLITTKRHLDERGLVALSPQVSEYAVATLDEARSEVWRRAGFGGPSSEAVRDAITEQGGTVGPLPDGTVIEVEPVGWARLWTTATANSTTAILDAFNERNA